MHQKLVQLFCLWHSVDVMVCYMQGQQISYDGDPLADFTMIRFLDRFVYRNPKKTKSKRKSIWLSVCLSVCLIWFSLTCCTESFTLKMEHVVAVFKGSASQVCFASLQWKAIPYLTLPPGWTGSYTCPALMPYQLGPMHVPECYQKVTGSGYKAVTAVRQ